MYLFYLFLLAPNLFFKVLVFFLTQVCWTFSQGFMAFFHFSDWLCCVIFWTLLNYPLCCISLLPLLSMPAAYITELSWLFPDFVYLFLPAIVCCELSLCRVDEIGTHSSLFLLPAALMSMPNLNWVCFISLYLSLQYSKDFYMIFICTVLKGFYGKWWAKVVLLA